MSGYKTHCSFNVFLALPALVGAQFYMHKPESVYLATFVGAFVYTTFFMSPDLDLVHNIRLRSVRGFFSVPFRAYSNVFCHRGVSHSFLFGSLTRIMWLGGIALMAFFLLYQTLPSTNSFLHCCKQYKGFLIYGFAGICLADWCHLLLDLKLR
ncbi:MAG: DUF2227 family putative metal-binding protein [Chlamydiales bacterium]|nr:DUF2227 family putative metal-binding protein [Chlamydiales bacterium]